MNAPSSIQIKNRSNKKQGFTLVELIVVIVIILILAAVLVPQLLRYVDRAQAAVCAENRHTVYIQVIATHTDGTHETLTDAFNALSDNEKEACPSGGVYSIVVADDGYSAEIVCSYHDEAEGGNNDDENTSGGGDVTNDDFYPDTSIPIQASYWPDPNDFESSSKNITVQPGGVFKHTNGSYYVVTSPISLSKNEATSGIDSKTSSMAVHKLTGQFITYRDPSSWSESKKANPGDLCQIGDDYYVFQTGSSSVYSPQLSSWAWYKLPNL